MKILNFLRLVVILNEVLAILNLTAAMLASGSLSSGDEFKHERIVRHLLYAIAFALMASLFKP